MEADRALIGRLQADSAGLQRHAHDLETQLTQVRIRQTQHENQIEGLQERIRADLGLVSLSYDAEVDRPPSPAHPRGRGRIAGGGRTAARY